MKKEILVMTKEEQSILQNMREAFPNESLEEMLQDIRECRDIGIDTEETQEFKDFMKKYWGQV